MILCGSPFNAKGRSTETRSTGQIISYPNWRLIQMKNSIPVLFLTALTFLVFAVVCVAAEKKPESPLQAIDFFDAKQQGLIEVKLVARNSLSARMQITNLTDEPLTVNKPFAFGAVPVLAQGGFFDDTMGGGGLGTGSGLGGGRGGRGSGSAGGTGTGLGGGGGGGNQSMGGGMGGMGGMGMDM